MLAFALWLVLSEKKIEKVAAQNEIFNIFFGGRYIILAMSFFSIYTGLIYNDVFAKSLNIFGSHFAYRSNFTFPLTLSSEKVMLDPGDREQYKMDPYYMGLDPVWQISTNKITFLNTYKMKISLIFGLIHMVFGVTLSLWNKLNGRKYAEILLEFIPQLVFLVFIFCYLIFLIFFKWVAYYADTAIKDTNTRSEHCAPNLLITFINMMLFKEDTPDPNLVAICKGRETYMFAGQKQLQMVLVIVGALMVPVMLLGKPLYKKYGGGARRRNYEQMRDELLGDDEGNVGDDSQVVVVSSSGGGHGDHDNQPFSEGKM